MPTLDDALEFVRDPTTTLLQLRRACAILSLEDSGDDPALRERLLDHLAGHEADQQVVCLNPNLPRE